MERHTKLVLAWHLGKRTRVATEDFIAKLRTATGDTPFQILTDGFAPYVNAIEDGLSDRVDYSQVVKVYGKTEDGREARYSPGHVVETIKKPILGNPDIWSVVARLTLKGRTGRYGSGASGSPV